MTLRPGCVAGHKRSRMMTGTGLGPAGLLRVEEQDLARTIRLAQLQVYINSLYYFCAEGCKALFFSPCWFVCFT